MLLANQDAYETEPETDDHIIRRSYEDIIKAGDNFLGYSNNYPEDDIIFQPFLCRSAYPPDLQNINTHEFMFVQCIYTRKSIK